MYPAPGWEPRHRMILGQGAQVRPDVDRTRRIERRKQRHQSAADAGVRGWIGCGSVQVWVLQRVGIDRHIPIFGESFQRPDVIEMTVRQDDSGGPAASAE